MDLVSRDAVSPREPTKVPTPSYPLPHFDLPRSEYCIEGPYIWEMGQVGGCSGVPPYENAAQTRSADVFYVYRSGLPTEYGVPWSASQLKSFHTLCFSKILRHLEIQIIEYKDEVIFPTSFQRPALVEYVAPFLHTRTC